MTQQQSMTKASLIAHLSDQSGVNKNDATAVIDALCDVITTNVSNGQAITLPGIGKISSRARNARMVRNPATGEQFEKAADHAIKFTVAKALKDAINE